ncbi:Ovate protein family [Macleaya cordata]|uniref:Transcription repressor n=1 Tax=Macleaya cordata TaxID=56857 RepID=A0A200Q4U2_MACCD|nr:Ovate protein family [Macleaya cordata]
MPKTLSKTIHHCFSKLKRSATTTLLLHSSPTRSLSTKDHNRPFLIKNFNNNNNLITSSTPKSLISTTTTSTHDFSSNNSNDSDYIETTPPDFATVFASQRFFFSSPGRSNSIIDSSCRFSDHEEESLKPPAPESDTIITGGIPIQTDSPDPYMDFRRSMQEMVEASELLDVRADWDYLHELLLSYLTLNPNKHTHKFIIDAFADLLVSLMTTSSSSSSPANNNVRFHRGSHRLILN